MKKLELYYNERFDLFRILYPSGLVEFYNENTDRWIKSFYTEKTFKASKKFISQAPHQLFLGSL